MKSNISTLICIFLSIFCYAQNSTITYYKDTYLNKEVSQEKANFSKEVTRNSDGTTTSLVMNSKKNSIKESKTFKGEEPYGIWIFKNGESIDTLDYNFDVVYDSITCKCNTSTNLASNKSPNANKIRQYTSQNIIYPIEAIELGLQGIVYTSFFLDKEGTIENIHIAKGTNILLDKEAMRVLRLMNFSNKELLIDGVEKQCFCMPIVYKLQ